MSISFEAAPRAVLEDVVQEREFQALTQIPVLAAMELGLVAAAFGLFAASSYFYLLGQLPLGVMCFGRAGTSITGAPAQQVNELSLAPAWLFTSAFISTF